MYSTSPENITTLTDVEIVAVKELLESCKRTFDVKKIILYGSKARGDYTSDSDVDILVFVGEDFSSDLRIKMSDVSFDINYKYDTQLSCMIRNESSLNESDGVTVITEAKREGILLES